MSLSAPFDQNSGSGQSPLGGAPLFADWGNQNQGAMTGGGALTPTSTIGAAQAPATVTSGAFPTNNTQPVIGAAQAPATVTSGASSPTNMMVNALANPAPQLGAAASASSPYPQ